MLSCVFVQQAVSAGPGEVTRRQRDRNWKTDWNLVKLNALKKELPPILIPSLI